jgi:hypothetical protein
VRKAFFQEFFFFFFLFLLKRYEASLVRKEGVLSFKTEDDDAGFLALVNHVSSFCNARSRSVGEVLSEAVRNFPKFVKDDDNDDDDDDNNDGDSGDEEEREIKGWVNEEPVKKAKQTPADHIDASVFNMPAIAR